MGRLLNPPELLFTGLGNGIRRQPVWKQPAHSCGVGVPQMERLFRAHQGQPGPPLASVLLQAPGSGPAARQETELPTSSSQGTVREAGRSSTAGQPSGQGLDILDPFAFPMLLNVPAALGQRWDPDDPLSEAPGYLQSRQPLPLQTQGLCWL